MEKKCALLAAAAVVLLALSSCNPLPNIGNSSGSCQAGSACSCDLIGNCSRDCPAGHCQFDCRGTSNCNFTCAGGGCTATCENTGNCLLACAGGGCNVVCMGNTGNCMCENGCSGGADLGTGAGDMSHADR